MAQHIFPELINGTGGLSSAAGSMIVIGSHHAMEIGDVLIDISYNIDAPESLPRGSMVFNERTGRAYQTYTTR